MGVVNEMNERIVFMGTPEFGRAILQELLDENRQVVGVVTQPDKPVGRKRIMTPSPVKQLAEEHAIPVLQPLKIREDYQGVVDLQPDLIVTCAFGQFIPRALLQLPRLGCINVHASLLPALRGGAPIQHAIIDGYKQTGITIMEMAMGMDSGDIISQKAIDIEENDTYGSLHDRLITVAVELLKETLPSVLEHSYTPLPQQDDLVTFGYNITREEEHIDLNKDYRGVYDQIRGLIPQPCGYVNVNGQKLKIWSAEPSDIGFEGENGLLHYTDDALGMAVDNRLILIKELQPEGKSRMSVKDFRNGAGRNWEGLKAE